MNPRPDRTTISVTLSRTERQHLIKACLSSAAAYDKVMRDTNARASVRAMAGAEAERWHEVAEMFV